MSDVPLAPLRVGLLVDSLEQPQWVASLIVELQTANVARIVVLLVDGGGAPTKPVRPGRQLLYRLYARLDEAYFRRQPDAFALGDLGMTLGGCPRVVLSGPSDAQNILVSDRDVRALRALGLDALLALGSRQLPSEAAGLARFGIWSFRRSDLAGLSGGADGGWEVMTAERVTTAALTLREVDAPEAKVVMTSTTATDSRSVWRNRSRSYWKANLMALRALRSLQRFGPDVLAESNC